MDIRKMIWSEKGIQWLEDEKENPNLEYHVADVSLDVDREFYQPPNMWNFQCEEDITYGEMVEKYLIEKASEMRDKYPTGYLILTALLPERDAWKRDNKEYLQLMESAFCKVDKNIIPVLVPFSQIRYLFSNESGKKIYINIERDWTDFLMVEKNQVVWKTSVAFGYKKGQDITIPINSRINDYKNNSTECWEKARFSNWMQGFEQIWKAIQNLGWEDYKEFYVRCPEEIRNVVSKMLTSSDRSVLKTISDTCAGILITQLLDAEIVKIDEQTWGSAEKTQKQKALVKENIWEL